jgi:serine/threonine protein kinase
MLADEGSTEEEGRVRESRRVRERNAGEVLAGTYRILRRIGAGGMADVYEVEHLRLGSRFAAKVLRGAGMDDPAARRFLREARLLASLKSDHIVTVVDLCGSDETLPFYVMELLEGSDLRQLLKSTPVLGVARAVKLVVDACLGMSVVHAAGVVHRDLKPENLFVTHRDTGEEVCKLLDFGVVKSDGGTSTQHGALIGTLRYMAPEQIEQAGTVGPRSDVCSLGAILYESLTGQPPYRADSFERLAYKILHETPAPLTDLRAELPPGLDAVVLKALERDPARRFPNVHAFAEALRPYSEQRTSEESESTSITPFAASGATRRRLTPSNFFRLAVACGVLLMVVVILRQKLEHGDGARSAVATTTVRVPVAAPLRPETISVPRAIASVRPEAPASSSHLAAAAGQPSEPSQARQRTVTPLAPRPRAGEGSPPPPFVRIDARNPYEQ